MSSKSNKSTFFNSVSPNTSFAPNLKILCHLGLCGALSYTIHWMVIFESSEIFDGIANTFPTLVISLSAMAISIPTLSSFIMSLFWITVFLDGPMYICVKIIIIAIIPEV